MTLASAQALCAHLVTLPLDLRADHSFFHALQNWCRRFTPLVAGEEMEGVFLDITGCAHLFGGEEAMLLTMHKKLRQLGVMACLALADTPGAAWALARFSGNRTIASPGRMADALARLPVAGLRLDEEVAAKLRRLGLRHIEKLYGLPRSSLAARFGMGLVTRLDQALGAAPEPLDFKAEAQVCQVSMRFAEPVGLVCDVAAALEKLLVRLCAMLARDGQGARKLMLTLIQVDNTRVRMEVGTVAPSRSPRDLALLFRDRLEGLDAGFGIEHIILQAALREPFFTRQEALTGIENKVVSNCDTLINRLANRLGFENVVAFSPAQSHLPERAFLVSSPAHMDSAHVGLQGGTFSHPPPVRRPLRLYRYPLPLGDSCPFEQVSGPERICPEWWHDDPAWRGGLRDYWWVRDEFGRSLWVYVEPENNPGPRWFLHGVGC